MAQTFKKKQESLYYIRPTDFRFVVVIIVFNNKNNMNHREGLFYSLKVLTYLLHRFTAPSDFIFDSYAGVYGYNERVLITESKFICTQIKTRAHNEGVDTEIIGFLISHVTLFTIR